MGERERRKEIYLPFVGSPLILWHLPGLRQAEARCQEPHPGLPICSRKPSVWAIIAPPPPGALLGSLSEAEEPELTWGYPSMWSWCSYSCLTCCAAQPVPKWHVSLCAKSQTPKECFTLVTKCLFSPDIIFFTTHSKAAFIPHRCKDSSLEKGIILLKD